MMYSCAPASSASTMRSSAASVVQSTTTGRSAAESRARAAEGS